MSSSEGAGQVPVEDLTPEQASHIIHSHRKVRYGTACWPCRQRKVKCDNKQPCENCVKREHPQLCSYKPNRTNATKSSSVSADSPHGKKRPRSPGDSPENDQPTELQEGWPRATQEEPEALDMTRYVGQNSIPALLREQPSPTESKSVVDIRGGMRPIFGLDNSAPFPLMSTKHLDRMTQEIFSELPSDREVMKLFRAYKEITHPFWGFVLDIDDLESRIMTYLEERDRSTRQYAKSGPPVSASWLAVLFAVLAVGAQFHDSPYHIRTRDSQRYVQISSHFLRLGNFLLRPNLDAIQALLIVGFVLLNDMKAEASWALIGMTCRLAQSLGLHRASTPDGSESSEQLTKNLMRRKLWWTCAWHDTLTSLSFDRSNMTSVQGCPIPLSPNASVDGYSYLEAMYHLNDIISQRLNPEATVDVAYDTIVDTCNAVDSLRDRVYPRLRNKDACKTALDRLQYYALRLHTSFVVSVCCRPSLRRGGTRLGPSEKTVLAERCKANLTDTVRMFLSMHQISPIPTRSWAFTYHGLSSAVLLGILCDAKKDVEIRGLQGDLITALSAAAAKERSSPVPDHIRKTDKDIELSGPLSRALAALKNIYDYGSLQGPGVMKSESISATRTPSQPVPQPVAQPNPLPPLPPPQSFDRHQDAALAMAELQNGNNMADFTPPPVSFSTAIPQVQPATNSMPGFENNLDPATLAPMELYDSIFWESPDPFYNAADMSFDFLPQIAPGQTQQHFYF